MDNNFSTSSNAKLYLGIFWIISIIAAGYFGFAFGQNSVPGKTNAEKNVLSAATEQVSSTPTPAAEITTALESNNVLPAATSNTSSYTCSKSGFAQKFEYLTAYVIKPNDSLQSIAKEQLKDETRGDEILKINGAESLVVGSTLYLPPSSIAKSSGNLKEVYGKLVEKSAASWHLNFSADEKGQGILIPSFLFDGIANKDSYKISDCLKIFLDDGYKIYSVSEQ